MFLRLFVLIDWFIDWLIDYFYSVTVWSNQVDERTFNSYLNISSAEVEDGGNYCCSIQKTKAASSSQSDQLSTLNQHCARLNVYGVAAVRWTANRTAVSGQDYALHCPFSGYPILSITWSRNNQVPTLQPPQTIWKRIPRVSHVFVVGSRQFVSCLYSSKISRYWCSLRLFNEAQIDSVGIRILNWIGFIRSFLIRWLTDWLILIFDWWRWSAKATNLNRQRTARWWLLQSTRSPTAESTPAPSVDLRYPSLKELFTSTS